MRGSLAKEPFLAVGHLWPVDSMLFQRRFASKCLGCGATYPTTTQHLLFPPPPPPSLVQQQTLAPRATTARHTLPPTGSCPSPSCFRIPHAYSTAARTRLLYPASRSQRGAI